MTKKKPFVNDLSVTTGSFFFLIFVFIWSSYSASEKRDHFHRNPYGIVPSEEKMVNSLS